MTAQSTQTMDADLIDTEHLAVRHARQGRTEARLMFESVLVRDLSREDTLREINAAVQRVETGPAPAAFVHAHLTTTDELVEDWLNEIAA